MADLSTFKLDSETISYDSSKETMTITTGTHVEG